MLFRSAEPKIPEGATEDQLEEIFRKNHQDILAYHQALADYPAKVEEGHRRFEAARDRAFKRACWYLKAMRLRVERARRNPAKDDEREAQVSGLEEALRRLPAKTDAAEVAQARWLMEELRVSLFAQELGTAEPVSAVKLERRIAELRTAAGSSIPANVASAAKPIVAAVARPTGPKSAPVKSLGALDRLLGRPRA